MFRILAVCTGNICRSPAAERLLASALGPSVHVESAGTFAMVGNPIDPPMAALLSADRISPDGFAARQLDEQQIRGADLILAMTREHRAHVVDLVPAAVRRTFALREFARRVETASERERGSVGGLPGLVRHAAEAWGRGADDDIPDPYGRSLADFELAYALIRESVGAIAGGGRAASALPPKSGNPGVSSRPTLDPDVHLESSTPPTPHEGK